MDNYFIFTEIVSCGKIGKIALDSFHKHHDLKVHVYGTKSDFSCIEFNENNIFIEVDREIVSGFEHGHVGTSLLWQKIIRECTSKYIIHFDSDVIFRDEIVNSMIKTSEMYDIVGPIRNYHHNPNMQNDVRHLADVCQTSCILFNKEKISHYFLTKKGPNQLSLVKRLFLFKYNIASILFSKRPSLDVFTRMILGTFSPFPFRNIDFFDPVMFDMIMNGAKIYHLDPDEVGGCDKYGRRDNAYKDINNYPTQYKLDFGRNLVHFSCVGSGMNFYLNPDAQKNVDKTYVANALDRYALFCKIFYQETIPGFMLEKYKKIIQIEKWY